MSTPALAKVNTTGTHRVSLYLVTPTSVGSGVCSVNMGDGDTLTEVPYYGSPVVGVTTLMFLFDGQLAVIGLGGTP